MRTSPSLMTSLVMLNLSSYSVPLRVFPPLYLRGSVPRFWSHLASRGVSRRSKRKHEHPQTLHNRQSHCLIRGYIIRVHLVIKHLSTGHVRSTSTATLGEEQTSASTSSSVKSAVNSGLSPKLSSPAADIGGSALELSGAGGG